MAINKEAMKLPDPLLVRFYRSGEIEEIRAVAVDEKTRHVSVEFDGRNERFVYLADVGWVPEQ